MISIFSTQQTFFPLFLLMAAKSSLMDLTAKNTKRLVRLVQHLHT